jgi:hypothetical protein
LYLHIETILINDKTSNISSYITLGSVAKCTTTSKLSGSKWDEVFLIEVPAESARLNMQFNEEGGSMVGECRYDIDPFFNHSGSPHSITSEIQNEQNEVKGTVSFRITYYSNEFGKLKIRVFHL